MQWINGYWREIRRPRIVVNIPQNPEMDRYEVERRRLDDKLRRYGIGGR